MHKLNLRSNGLGILRSIIMRGIAVYLKGSLIRIYYEDSQRLYYQLKQGYNWNVKTKK